MKQLKNFDEFLNDLNKKDEDTISIKEIREHATKQDVLYRPLKHPLNNDKWIYTWQWMVC